MPPIRGHPKTFVLFDPANEDDDDDDFGMPPLVDNPFAFTSSPKSDVTDYSPNPNARKFTFEHDLIKHTADLDDGPLAPTDRPEQVQTITFAPPYIPPSRLSRLAHEIETIDDSDLPPLVEPSYNEDKADSDRNELNFLANQPFAADMETSALQRRDLKDPSYIPRPPNAFILFRSSFIKAHKDSGGRSGSKTLAKTISLAWRNLPPEERAEWENKALIAQAEHRQRYPDWRFNHATGDGKRRAKKVKDGPALKGHKRSTSGKVDPRSRGGKGRDKDSQEEKPARDPAHHEAGFINNFPSLPHYSKQEQLSDAQFLSGNPQQALQEWPNSHVQLRDSEVNGAARFTRGLPTNTSFETIASFNTIVPQESIEALPRDLQALEESLSGLPHISTSTLPGDTFSDFWPSHFSEADSASPPPTSPFMGSDSLSSPESPFKISFQEPLLPSSNTLNSGPHSAPGLDRPRPFGAHFMMPASAATRLPSPAVVVATMYQQSLAGLPSTVRGSLSYGGTPISSSLPSEIEELGPSNGLKSPILKRSSSAPAPRNRLRLLAHPTVVLEGSEPIQSQESTEEQPSAPPSLGAPSKRSMMERVRPSISEGNIRGHAPRVPPSPTKRGRFRAMTQTVSSIIRGPRRLLGHERRESFSSYSPAQALLPMRPANPTFEDNSFYDIYNQPANEVQSAPPNHLDFASISNPPPLIPNFSLPMRPQYHRIQSPPNGISFHSAENFLPNPQPQQMEGDYNQYDHNYTPPSSGSNSINIPFSFGFTPSSSFSSLANWAGGSTEGHHE